MLFPFFSQIDGGLHQFPLNIDTTVFWILKIESRLHKTRPI